MKELTSFFQGIASDLPEDDPRPRWNNAWLSGLDAVSLCTMLYTFKPLNYFEVGSGNSTRFARETISHFGLPTRLWSVDPEPRVDIDRLCDMKLKIPLEDVSLDIFGELEAGDILFVDGTHQVFMNSDTAVFFLDILPILKPGVIVHLHDIFLPSDYPPTWIDRYYSEQYMLAASLLAERSRLEVMLPVFFIYQEQQLADLLLPLWQNLPMVSRHGASFWMKIKSS